MTQFEFITNLVTRWHWLQFESTNLMRMPLREVAMLWFNCHSALLTLPPFLLALSSLPLVSSSGNDDCGDLKQLPTSGGLRSLVHLANCCCYNWYEFEDIFRLLQLEIMKQFEMGNGNIGIEWWGHRERHRFQFPQDIADISRKLHFSMWHHKCHFDLFSITFPKGSLIQLQQIMVAFNAMHCNALSW